MKMEPIYADKKIHEIQSTNKTRLKLPSMRTPKGIAYANTILNLFIGPKLCKGFQEYNT